MSYRRAVVRFTVIICIILAVGGLANADTRFPTGQGTISYALQQPDNTVVTLDMVVISEVRPEGVVVHEWWGKELKIIALFAPPTYLKITHTIDVRGRISTLPMGERAIICTQIGIYKNSTGEYSGSVPPMKGIVTPGTWPYQEWIDVYQYHPLQGIQTMSDPSPPGEGDSSDPPVLADPPEGMVAEAKTVEDGQGLPNSLLGKIVTAGNDQFDGCIYISEPDRSSGIRVVPTSGTFAPGDEVSITAGTLGTSQGERFINQATVSKTGQPGEPSPLGLPNRNLGGGPFAYGAGQSGVLGGSGLNNIGLLVKTWGKITHNGNTYIYIDDGSALEDGSGYTGVRVETSHLASGNNIGFPSVDDYLVIDGISSCMVLNNEIVRVLRPRSQADIVLPTSPPTKPQIPQGSSETFAADVPGDPPQGSVQWDIILNGNQVATSDQPDGWLVTLGGLQKFTVGVPTDAEVATDYQVRYSEGSTIASAYFDVTPASNNPKVPQGGSAIFASIGQDAPDQGLTWDITLESNVIATDLNSNGWTVVYDGSDLFTVSAPSSAQVAQDYEVRYREDTETASALFDVTSNNAGEPMPDVPAPAWALDVIPAYSVPAGMFGPSASTSVNLASGVSENKPGPDIVVHNPNGPDVVFERLYRSALSEGNYASPGLSSGWVHNYDVRIQATSGSWGDITLISPNQAQEILSPVLDGGVPTGAFQPSGAPYVVRGQAGWTPGQWDWIGIEFRDGSNWTLTAPDPGNPSLLLLSRITGPANRYVNINRISSSDHRVQTITDQAGGTLLSFAYDPTAGYLATLIDASGRQITFTFGQTAGNTCLTGVSRIDNPNAISWAYGYTAVGDPARAYLTAVAVPDPTQPDTDIGIVRGHPINYDANGHVSSLVDANGNQRIFRYNGDRTVVEVRSPSGILVERWTRACPRFS